MKRTNFSVFFHGQDFSSYATMKVRNFLRKAVFPLTKPEGGFMYKMKSLVSPNISIDAKWLLKKGENHERRIG
jgi:hypothetical protein